VKQSFRIAQGDDVYLQVAVSLDGVSTPIGDAELFLTIKRNATDPDAAALVQLTRSGGGITATDDNNIAVAHIPAAATANAKLGRYVFDVRLAGVDAPDVQTLASGEILIEAAITQSTGS